MILLAVQSARAEAMLALFRLTWNQIAQKMPEIAEAGYDSLWLPIPAKGNSGASSVGYDLFDPFDLGSANQQGTVATAYGTQADLVQMVQIAHRFGIRVYFDNVMNHRAFVVPGYPGSGTPTNYYPGLIPQDFHFQTVSGGFENWPQVSDWCDVQNVENQPLLGLCDLAEEPGNVNWNFGAKLGDTAPKPVFVRFPNRPDLYMDTNGPFLGAGLGGAGWRPFDGRGQPVPEDVTAYLCRAVAWTLYTTKCDGFRLDAVKHVPISFFGAETGQADDPSFYGYTGAIQAMFDYVHGYGSNVTGNGYMETDGNRNSLFNTEAPRNDAMIFGEYEPASLAAGEDFYDYLQSGLRLLNFPLYTQMNSILAGGATMSGLDGRDYIPPGQNCDANGNFSPAQAVNMPQTQDDGSCCPANEGLENAYFFMREGLPMAYSDGFNHNPNGGTPIVSYANFLGEFGDNTMPDTMYLHDQLSRGGTWPRWSDQNTALFERYDYREGNGAQPQTQAVALFGMNDKTNFPGDISFDDGVTRASDGYYLNSSNTASTAVSNPRGVGVVVGFAPGTILAQLSSASPAGGRAYQRLLVHGATGNLSEAQASANLPDPAQRLIYVGSQALASGGGAVELTIPSGSWVIYGCQWPQPSQANPSTNAIILRQNGAEAPRLIVYRQDGPNGDAKYNPLYPFKMRGSLDPLGNVIGGANVSNFTYAIDVPIITNASFDIIVRGDASSANMLVKLDGGIDLNSQMGIGPASFRAGMAPTNFLDLRDNPPGYTDDVFLGYEQTAFAFRNGPEKFAARNTQSNNIVSLGAETYSYTVGGGSNITAGTGCGAAITNETAAWVWHDPAGGVTSLSANLNPAAQRNPLSPTAGQSSDVWVKVGYQFQINTCFIYYTTDGSIPDGAFGMPKGTTQVAAGSWVNHDSAQNNIDWWKGTIPAQPAGTRVLYKIALFNGGSFGYSAGDTNHWPSIGPISDAEPSRSKLFGLAQNVISNFNPATAVVWLHNDLNPSNTVAGLQPGFHILRARVFLPRAGQASVYNTFLQTFYYDGALPQGAIAYPPNGGTISSSSYTLVVRGDSTVTGVGVNIQDANSKGSNVFLPATPIAVPDPAVSAAYPNYPREFRFVYTNIPSAGTATISVRLNEYGTGVYTNHYTKLSETVSTLAPAAGPSVEISSPGADGAIITMTSNTTYLFRACFTSTLDTNDQSLFTLTINGVEQPQSSFLLRPAGFNPTGAPPACSGMSSLFYMWTLNSPGTTAGSNLLQVVYKNNSTGVTLASARSVIAAPPLLITNLGGHNQLVVWDSAPGVTYQVLATTNLAQPFQPISGNVSSQGASTSFYDPNPAPQKFYEIEEVP
ncbi:MAG TPA: alpha-amylase family glycosyl hydrolase [Verrucomicrobiae bacterium]|jgi:hypothetical protein